MAPDSSSWLHQLAGTSEERIAALRCLKNDIIGSLQKKEQWVRHGVLPPVVAILSSVPDVAENESRQSFLSSSTLTDQDVARLLALQLLASFACAGPTFLPPLHASGILPAVTSHSCLQNKRRSIVLASLRVLREITAAARTAAAHAPINPSSLADTLYATTHIESLYHILSQPASNRDIEGQVFIVAYLIKTLCKEEHHQSALISNGILDALAMHLASIAVAGGYVIPMAEAAGSAEGLAGCIPDAAISSKNLGQILAAISAIITDSPYRACKLLYSAPILATFPIIEYSGSNSTTAAGSFELPGLAPTKPLGADYMGLLLPQIPAQVRGQPAHPPFPPLGIFGSKDNVNPGGRPSSKLQSSLVSWTPPEETFTSHSDPDKDQGESPLIPWLMHLIRSVDTEAAMMAASVLVSLFKAGLAYKIREAALGLLIVPVLLSRLKDMTKTLDLSEVSSAQDSKLELVREIPAVLARLVTDSEPLQKAAFDCDAIWIMCNCLKITYNGSVATTKAQTWSPDDQDDTQTEILAPECQLGEDSECRCSIHLSKLRENVLRALGAMATFKEEYRKQIVDEDMMPYIVESLSPSPAGPRHLKERTKGTGPKSSGGGREVCSEFGCNPTTVIIAACYAIRMLSRSVNILRTTLVDHQVSTPLFRLLRHRDVDVQIAATACICNLVPDFSPMRQALIDAGILKVLCEHAHSLNPSLRLNALWALKHLVDSAPVELKKRAVEELESGWLVQLVHDDTEDDALFSARGRNDRQAGQGILEDMDEDMEMDVTDEQTRPWLSTSFYKTSTPLSQSEARIFRLAESRLSRLRESELNPARKARHDDLAIQEQGLGFIRNLIGGTQSSSITDSTNGTTGMIDFLFNTIGQDRLFKILASKLKVKVVRPYSRRSAAGSETRLLPPRAKVIEAVIYILVHMAASVPRHRQLVIAQTDLLKQLTKLFNSQDREVRVALCHLINNLTWQDDQADANACSQRAIELGKLGFLSKLDALSQGDDELDVRERAKSAIWQMRHGQ
ncbi:armadillo repeat protein [Xylariomycetidae sp. FL2044]|nr:armadillo repeat protein [Xylariomycetidae sp. FL2044]